MDTDQSSSQAGCREFCGSYFDVGCLYAGLTPQEAFTFLGVLFVVCVAVAIAGAFMFYKRRQAVTRLRHAQRVSNMQLVSTCESTYRHYCEPHSQSSGGSLYEQYHVNGAYSRPTSGSSSTAGSSSREIVNAALSKAKTSI